MNKCTKIIGTLGPASESESTIRSMILAGMDMVRLNFSHGTHEEHRSFVETVKRLRSEMDRPIGIILDTKGPCIRTGALENGGPISLFAGNRLILTEREIAGTPECIQQSFPGLGTFVEVGSTILLDDGLIELAVDAVEGPDIICTVQNPGTLGERKQLNIPEVTIPLPIMTPQDQHDLLLGIELGVDYVAASFVRNAEDVRQVRAFLREHGGAHIDVMAKIENAQAVDNLDEIIAASDAIMVARGDLGVEVDPASVPHLQKKIIKACNSAFCPVVIATHMLDSMIHHPHPTRAEVTDVANAIYDGADAVMLSGETAIGTYPQLTIQTMARIAEASEPYLLQEAIVPNRSAAYPRVTPTIALAAVSIAESLGASCIFTPTLTGRTARFVSNYRPKVPIYAVTASEEVARKLSLYWGVRSVRGAIQGDATQVLEHSQQAVVDAYLAKPGDLAVFTLGNRRTSPELSGLTGQPMDIGGTFGQPANAENTSEWAGQPPVHATNVVEVVQISATPRAGSAAEGATEAAAPSAVESEGSR